MAVTDLKAESFLFIVLEVLSLEGNYQVVEKLAKWIALPRF
jgi:hypothetical protein